MPRPLTELAEMPSPVPAAVTDTANPLPPFCAYSVGFEPLDTLLMASPPLVLATFKAETADELVSDSGATTFAVTPVTDPLKITAALKVMASATPPLNWALPVALRATGPEASKPIPEVLVAWTPIPVPVFAPLPAPVVLLTLPKTPIPLVLAPSTPYPVLLFKPKIAGELLEMLPYRPMLVVLVPKMP